MEIPAGLTELARETFYSGHLQRVTFTEGSRLERVERSAFESTRLETFAAPPSLRVICSQAFYHCGGLKEVILNEGLETLGADHEEGLCGVFQYTSIERVCLPSTLLEIGNFTFHHCQRLGRLDLPAGL